ncbi:DUF4190 domain-containing protein [Streptomyces sp. TS71-3]|uniref:DUF4190 domain-containing protein n=1 Tax=Streptomyces sp. TS71-3 TaxID=2733862 RepID=UPI001B25BD97|nr:DUF4190 domain-containing protein [Streptomyces sp. TS71-3]GHJ42003.1 hypothetical protein Sm713_76120 [Streptomyces sp. TS71-3]
MSVHEGHDPEKSLPYSPGYAPPVRSNGLAVAALVLGVLALISFWTILGGVVLGIIALILGIIAAARARGGRAKHRGMSITGAVLGGIGLVASVILLVAGISFLSSDEFSSYKDCVNHANSQADQEDCARQFKHDVEGG